MIGVPTALLIGTILLLALLFLATRGSAVAGSLSAKSDVSLLEDAGELAPCPPEFVARIFDSADWRFVARANSPQLESLFRRERKLVALLWVQQTSAAIQHIMRQHKEASRQSDDLNFSTETKIILLYSQLLLICGLLSVAIQASGPQHVRGLAVYADTLSHRLAEVEQGFRIATTGRQLHNAGSS